MSKLSLKGNPSGTGNFSIEAPNSNVDRTLNLPDEAGTLATVENLPAGYTDTDALDLFNVTGSAPVYACRAWVNFSGGSVSSGTAGIRDSGNVSSITDNGTGDYEISFTTAMPSDNYSATITGGRYFSTSDQPSVISTYAFGAASLRFAVINLSGSKFDPDAVCVSIVT